MSSIGTTGIGFAVPNEHLHSLIQGRVGKPVIFAAPADTQTIQLNIEGHVQDPFGVLRGVPSLPAGYLRGTPAHARCRRAMAAARCEAGGGSALGRDREGVDSPAANDRGRTFGGSSRFARPNPRTARRAVESGMADLPRRCHVRQIPHVPVRRRPQGIAPVFVKSTATLKDVNRSPDRFLGHVLTLDGVFSQELERGGGKAVMGIGFDRRHRPENLKFVAPASLADQCREAIKDEGTLVRVAGSLLAPTTMNGAYVFEIDEMNVLGNDGVITASYKPAPVTPPPPSTKEPSPAPEPVAVPETDAEPTIDGYSQGTVLAAALAIIFGGLVGGYLLLKQQSRVKPVAVPTSTVAERLQRRVK